MMKRMMALALVIMLFTLPITAMADTFDISHTVAYMDSHFTCGCSRGGSGTMISRYGLVTAAHNLYCHVHSEPLQYCDFYFGANSPGSCWYKYDGKFTYRVYDTFTNGYSSKDDIGYVIFNSPVGGETGWCASIAGSDHYLNEEFTHVLSYDGTRHLQTIFDIQYVLDSKQIYWPGWISGTDGGPVCFWYEGLEFPQVVAVYTSHDDNGNGYGRRLTNEIFDHMREAGAFN